MAKVRPKIPNRRPGEPGDRNPDPREPRPSERDPVFKEIGKIITDAWEAAAGKHQLDRDTLQQRISAQLRLAGDGDPMGDVEVGVIVDPKPEKDGRKFIWIVIPYLETPKGSDDKEWLDHYKDPKVQTQLGEAVLFGCGR